MVFDMHLASQPASGAPVVVDHPRGAAVIHTYPTLLRTRIRITTGSWNTYCPGCLPTTPFSKCSRAASQCGTHAAGASTTDRARSRSCGRRRRSSRLRPVKKKDGLFRQSGLAHGAAGSRAPSVLRLPAHRHPCRMLELPREQTRYAFSHWQQRLPQLLRIDESCQNRPSSVRIWIFSLILVTPTGCPHP